MGREDDIRGWVSDQLHSLIGKCFLFYRQQRYQRQHLCPRAPALLSVPLPSLFHFFTTPFPGLMVCRNV